MDPRRSVSWRRWPVAAGLLALLFIAYGISLVSRTSTLQQRMGHEVALLEELGRLNDALNDLSLVHRVDLKTDNFKWAGELASVKAKIEATEKKFGGSPGMDELSSSLQSILHQADSVHREAMGRSRLNEQRHAEAIFQLMLKRAQKALDKTSRRIHEDGLAIHNATMSRRWNEAQLLLITACLMAVVFAWLVGMSNRLLYESREHAMELAEAKKELEHINMELRETMLSKEEKEMMIKEIHHRVKNNLQIVKSLIRFQMDQVKDPRVTELFNECVNRVSAMALVHEQTYLSKDLANIDVNTYLGHLIRDLCHAYTIDTRLELDIRINLPRLGVDTLIPLGLLINEIISNSLKYAFRGRTSGVIFVHLDGEQENGIHLRIGDNGTGLPDRTRWNNPQSLGMELIHTLSDQLDARIVLEEGPGTVYNINAQRQEKQLRA